MRRQEGGIAVQLLGSALFLFLLVGGLGLAELARAMAIRTAALRSLTAAVQSAARAPSPDRETTFQQILHANLPGDGYMADLTFLPPGSPDPATGVGLEGPALVGHLHLPFRLTYFARWAPAVTLEFAHTEPLRNRKPGP